MRNRKQQKRAADERKQRANEAFDKAIDEALKASRKGSK